MQMLAEEILSQLSVKQDRRIAGPPPISPNPLVNPQTTEDNSYLPLPLGEGWGEGLLRRRPRLMFCL